MRKMSLGAFNFCLALCICASAKALEFQRHSNDTSSLNAILAKGSIVAGDADRLLEYVYSLPEKQRTAVYLDSPGGNLHEGMELGRLFKRFRIKTVVEAGQMCASACAIAFLGGRDRSGKKWMSSTTNSRLGFHAFRNGDGSKTSSTDDTQSTVAAVLQYAREVDAPMEILIKNFGTSSSRMYWFSKYELLSLGIRVWHNKKKCFLPCDGSNNSGGIGFVTRVPPRPRPPPSRGRDNNSGTTARMMRHSNRYVHGDGYVTYHPGSFQACSSICSSKRKCAMAEFYKPEGKCSLFRHRNIAGRSRDTIIAIKSGGGSSTTSTSSTRSSSSSSKIRRRNNRYVEGEGYSTTRTNSYAACARRCKRDSACRMLEYFKPERKCNLFRRLRKTGSSRKAIIGVKQ